MGLPFDAFAARRYPSPDHQVITVERTVVASYGTINSPGYNPQTAVEMNGPYSAYVIGDYTGITPPY